MVLTETDMRVALTQFCQHRDPHHVSVLTESSRAFRADGLSCPSQIVLKLRKTGV